MTLTVGDALKLSGETRAALVRAQDNLNRLTDAGVKKPSVLSELIEPTLRIKERLEQENAELEAIIHRLGL